jgi:hypothetical protein
VIVQAVEEEVGHVQSFGEDEMEPTKLTMALLSFRRVALRQRLPFFLMMRRLTLTTVVVSFFGTLRLFHRGDSQFVIIGKHRSRF